jgi:ZIP family zinc transporter
MKILDVGLFAELGFVFVAGFLTALATGLGAIPFFVVDDVSDRVNVALWGLASGIMVSASLFGLVDEGLASGTIGEVFFGVIAGIVLVIVADWLLEGHDFQAEELATADGKKLALILGVLTVHSFPEGIAVGVSFADLGLAGGIDVFGVAVPILAIFMTIAISIHNIPEGLAISIPLRAMGQSRWRMVGLAVFSSLPQPIGAVIAYAFVEFSRQALPIGFGFAAGAMVYLVLTEFIPEALDSGASLPGGGRQELAVGVLTGFILMLPLLFVA